MDEIVQYLTGIPAWYLATIDAADPTQPRVRPFSFAAQADGKLWFSTSRDKDVWRELEANAKFELSGWKPGECWIVVEGEAELADDEVCPDEVRQAGFEHMIGIGEHHDSPNDGRLAFFSVKNGTCRICDIDGSERKFSSRPHANPMFCSISARSPASHESATSREPIASANCSRRRLVRSASKRFTAASFFFQFGAVHLCKVQIKLGKWYYVFSWIQ